MPVSCCPEPRNSRCNHFFVSVEFANKFFPGSLLFDWTGSRHGRQRTEAATIRENVVKQFRVGESDRNTLHRTHRQATNRAMVCVRKDAVVLLDRRNYLFQEAPS